MIDRITWQHEQTSRRQNGPSPQAPARIRLYSLLRARPALLVGPHDKMDQLPLFRLPVSPLEIPDVEKNSPPFVFKITEASIIIPFSDSTLQSHFSA